MMRWWAQSLLLFKKDLWIEFRTREMMNVLLIFSVLSVVIFNFAWVMSRETVFGMIPGLFWITFLFAGILGLTRSAVLDREENRLEGLLLTPVSGSALYAGKLAANLTFVLLVELLAVPIFVIFFDLPFRSDQAWLLLVLFLGTLGFSTVGVLLSAVSVRTRLREIFLPVLMLPVVAPVLVGSVKATEAWVGRGGGFADGIFWLKFLAGYDLIFLILGMLLYEFAVSE